MHTDLVRALEVLVALLRLVSHNFPLAYYWLPRDWRGGYRSPWLSP